MRKQFDQELNELHIQFTNMGVLVSEALTKSVKAFINHDVTLAQTVIDDDQIINKKEVELEEACAKIIALQQPVVTDLRRVVSVMKACSDWERMGDHASSIAKTTITVKGKKRISHVEALLADMAKVVIEMANRVITAYTLADIEEARAIAELDERVDNYLLQITQFTIAEMKADPKVVFNGSGYITVASDVERAADYITNICERIIYLKTGEIVELN
ncbi:phosphate uptake regulator, PhoU [Granulicatella balaenopterae]|uniref:Phosphate-specific transport system accessory protein PhoU n=1 Tax=Granulicatella balaenopterae TaxID=137733 RepID=A0A1H9M2C7_9LACT|nr:phosphate signaling complex protein PhoU [Granulicatella balaenopterae]SER17645.1 phosphate uptake regulator, PhoU [Granulicatella balaenopterae]